MSIPCSGIDSDETCHNYWFKCAFSDAFYIHVCSENLRVRIYFRASLLQALLANSVVENYMCVYRTKEMCHILRHKRKCYGTLRFPRTNQRIDKSFRG